MLILTCKEPDAATAGKTRGFKFQGGSMRLLFVPCILAVSGFSALVPLAGCADGAPLDATRIQEAPRPKAAVATLHLMLATHNEADDSQDPINYNSGSYLTARLLLIDMVNTILGDRTAYGVPDVDPVAYNWQSDSEFLEGAALRDPENAATGYTNVVDWMDQQGVEVSPHIHEATSAFTYPEVAEMLSGLGVDEGGEVVGGFAYGGTDWLGYDNSSTGTFDWTPSVLWGASENGNHPTDSASGVWRPDGDSSTTPQDFRRHDASAPNLPYLGGGCENAITPGEDPADVVADVAAIYDDISRTTEELWTHRIMIHQRHFDEIADNPDDYIELVATVIDAINDEYSAGQIVWATPSEVLHVWTHEYGTTPDQRHPQSSCP